MDSVLRKTNFFLEAYTPHGLCSFYDGFCGSDKLETTYLVTGGIASSCSMVIKLASDNLTNQGYVAHQISNPLCSHQLDAVYFPELDVCISNGGERGVVSTQCPIATEQVVSLAPCFDCEGIKENYHDIKRMFSEVKSIKLRASGFLSAAQSLINDSKIIERKYMDTDKITRYVSRLVRKEFATKQGRKGRDYKRFLSSLTSKGVETYTQTLLNLCERFYIFNDRYGAVSDYLIGLIKNHSLGCGYDVISCYCPISGGFSVEHLIVPELSLCFFSDKIYHSAEFVEHRKISFNRFVDLNFLRDHKKRLSFDKKGANEMLGEAVKLFATAESIQKRLDFIYFSHLDKAGIYALGDKIADEILNRK